DPFARQGQRFGVGVADNGVWINMRNPGGSQAAVGQLPVRLIGDKKNAIIAKLQALLDEGSNNVQAVKDLQAEWNEVGHVPFRKKDKVFKHYREVCDKLYDGFHASAGKRHLENFKKSVADKAGSDLTRDRQRLQRDIETKKNEIQNYETNLSFFNSKSKSGNSLVEDILKKIERLKEDLVLLNEKLAAVNAQIKAEK
ncbi:MAG: DUF349 domain-containing protein, partial [Bacteroidaceae bacterium]|nr:DUF349 domain-containing protein [Bacteroidaceae bacterium]